MIKLFKKVDNVGWTFSPTLKYCWGRNPNLQKAISYASRKTTRHVKGDLVHAFILPEVTILQLASKVAFTLAEVLITLGIIGVVAAMTLPTLIANYQKKETVVRLQKIYSQLNQVIKLAEAEHGSIDSWNYANMGSNINEIKEYFLNNYIIKHMKILKKCDSSNISECITPKIMDLNGKLMYEPSTKIGIFTQDGYGILFWFGGINTSDNTSTYSPHVHFFVDINGPKNGENRLGKDIFMISAFFGPQLAQEDNGTTSETRPKRSGVYLYGNGWQPELTRDELLTTSYGGCNKTIPTYGGAMCGALIQRDGWEIKDDYPWR